MLKIRNLSMLPLVLCGLGLLSTATLAEEPSGGMIAEMALAGGKSACGDAVAVHLDVRNVDSLPLDLVRLDLIDPQLVPGAASPGLAPDVAPGQDDPKELPLPPAGLGETVPTRLRATVKMPMPGQKPGSGTRLKLSLVRPLQDGYYTDVARVKYAYQAAAPVVHEIENDAEAVLYYEVAGDCVQQLTLDQFQAATDQPSGYQVAYDGGTVPFEGAGGLADPPWAAETSSAKTLLEVRGEQTRFYNDDPPSAEGGKLDLRYCVRVRYRDHFAGCPSDATGMKWWQPYCDDRMVPLLGLEVWLLDRDANSHDDVIGRYALHYEGLEDYSCIDFEWDQRVRGEDYPDLYVKTSFDVHDTEFNAGQQAHLCRNDEEELDACSIKFQLDWRARYEPDMDDSATVFKSLNFGPATLAWNRRAMSMAAVQKVLRGFQGRNSTGDFNVWWDGTQCMSDHDGDPTTPPLPWSCSYDDNWFTMAARNYRRWTTGPHEAGHSYQKQLFEQGFLTGAGCPSPHFLNTVGNDACATKEGWAEFFSIVTWYTGREAKSHGAPVYFTSDVENGGSPPATACADNARTELEVLRTLWDTYDSQTDGSDNTNGQERWKFLETWDAFADGSGNQEDMEDDADSLNLWDFYSNVPLSSQLRGDMIVAMRENETRCQSWY